MLDYVGPPRTPAERAEAVALWQREYARLGMLGSEPWPMPNVTYVAVHGGRVVGTGSLYMGSLPSRREFAALAKLERPAEASRLACVPVGALAPHSISEQLIPHAIRIAREWAATDLVVCVHPRHERYWRESQGFERIAGPAPISRVNGQQGVLMRLVL